MTFQPDEDFSTAVTGVCVWNLRPRDIALERMFKVSL